MHAHSSLVTRRIRIRKERDTYETRQATIDLQSHVLHMTAQMLNLMERQ